MKLVPYSAKLDFINSFAEGIIENEKRSEALQRLFDKDYHENTKKDVVFQSLAKVYRENQR